MVSNMAAKRVGKLKLRIECGLGPATPSRIGSWFPVLLFDTAGGGAMIALARQYS